MFYSIFDDVRVIYIRCSKINVLSLQDKYSLIKIYLNIFMWDLVSKDLLQEIRWCNRNLIQIPGLAFMTFLLQNKPLCDDISNFVLFCLSCLLVCTGLLSLPVPCACVNTACKAPAITAKIIFPALCRRVALVRTAGLQEAPCRPPRAGLNHMRLSRRLLMTPRGGRPCQLDFHGGGRLYGGERNVM